MNETPMERALRLCRENSYYGSGFTVCPRCGMSTLRRSGTWVYCFNCGGSMDIDEVSK